MNQIPKWLADEWKRAGLNNPEADFRRRQNWGVFGNFVLLASFTILAIAVTVALVAWMWPYSGPVGTLGMMALTMLIGRALFRLLD